MFFSFKITEFMSVLKSSVGEGSSIFVVDMFSEVLLFRLLSVQGKA